MGLPDTFVIPTEVPLSHQYRIVGNGVAYPVAAALACAMREQLEKRIGGKWQQAS